MHLSRLKMDVIKITVFSFQLIMLISAFNIINEYLGVRHNRLPDLQATKVKATLYSATKL